MHGCPVHHLPVTNRRCQYDRDVACASSHFCPVKKIPDYWTKALVRMLADRIEVLTGGRRPYVVIGLVHRYFVYLIAQITENIAYLINQSTSLYIHGRHKYSWVSCKVFLMFEQGTI